MWNIRIITAQAGHHYCVHSNSCNRTKMWKSVFSLMILTVIHFPQILNAKNVTCKGNEFTCKNGECILSRWRCDGENDCLDASDEQNCEVIHPTCSSSQFRCNTTKVCVPVSWRCDRDNDCGDWSDELNCRKCTVEEHRCPSGLCLAQEYVCDGEKDCEDSSDEDEISCRKIVHCKENEFRCHERRCILDEWRCDDEEDCLDGRDEVNCTSHPCLPQYWRCGSGECIPEEFRCDGDPDDCRDFSDEQGCGNGSTICDAKTEFQCTSGQCVSSEGICDGSFDCIDRSDEKNCDGRGGKNCSIKVQGISTCLQKQFRCWNDQYIDEAKVCNRVKDCDDGSDEFKCPSYKNQTSCGLNRGGCQHRCHDNGNSFNCSCDEGFETDPQDSKHCIDIDECEIIGFCSQECANGHGSYNCSCHKGYVLKSDGRKCKALGPDPRLLLSNEGEIKITTLQSLNEIQASVDGLQNSLAVDYCLEENLMFWTDTVLQTINSASLDGSLIRNVVRFGLETPSGLAVDWLGKKLFWTDADSGRIELSNFNGTQRKAIFWEPRGRLRAIAVHPSKGYLFWTEWDMGDKYTKSSIARANMDGSDVVRIIFGEIIWPNALTVDYITQRIFFVDGKDGLIGYADLDGSSIRTTIKAPVLQPFSVSIFEDTLYWTDAASKAIFKTNKFDGQQFSLLGRNVKSPMGIAVIHHSRQPQGNYNCGDDNGRCSHICLPTSNRRSCACPTGYKMLNSTHCTEKIDKFVAYAADYLVRQISLDTDDMLDVVLPFESVLDIIAMDWDPNENEMYWADTYNGEVTIKKGKMRPPYHEAVVHKSPGKLSGIGVDWLTRKLYWCDKERNHILVSNLDGTSTTVILWRNIVKPRNLLLHVEKRYMYWSSHGMVVTINRAGMDGSSRKKLVSGGLVNPTDLTLDKARNILYWVDGGDTVHYTSLTTRRRRVLKVLYQSKTLSPFSIAVDGDRIFWADSRLKKVLYMNMKKKDGAKLIGKFKTRPLKLAVFERVRTQGRNPCTLDNGNCSHLCLLSPSQDFLCACPAGQRLKADNKTCEKEISRFVLINSNGRLYQVPLGVPYKTDIFIDSEHNKDVFAFDVDLKQRSVYFIKKTTNRKEICRISLSGGNHTCIFSDILHAPGDIAYDPVRQNIYWTDFLTKKIYLADSKGTFWTVIIWKKLDLPSSITVAYKHGFIFWADLGNQITISRANMDGSSQSRIVTSGMKWPNSLTVDHVKGHVYWTDYLQQRIESCDFDGKNRRRFASTLFGPTSLTMFSKFVFWSEWQAKVLRKRGKNQTGLAITVLKGLKEVTGIQAVNLLKVLATQDTCKRDNGNCSHFCLNNPDGLSCACPVGLKLYDDGKTCYDRPIRSILYSSGKTIRRISLDTGDLTSVPLPVRYANITINFAFHVTGDHVYWTDGTRIYSASSNGTDTKTVITADTSSIKGLTVEESSGNLFWTDFVNARIMVSKINGSLCADLISDRLKEPREIVVDEMKGLLFWSDTGRRVIESSHSDGQSRVMIASNNVHYPIGLTADVDTEFLYWVESTHHTVERCSYDGKKRFTVVKRNVHALGLTVFGSHVYWTDHRRRALLRADKETGSQLHVLDGDLEIPMAIAALSRKKRAGTSRCFENNGNCSSLCLATPNGRSCASVCGGQLYLKDSCNNAKFVKESTRSVQSPTSCTVIGSSVGCSVGIIINVDKEKKKTKIAYIVGGIVVLAFIITMSVLVFLCQRRLKTASTRKKQKQLMSFGVSLESRLSTSKGDSVNVPLVPMSSDHPSDQVSTASSQPGYKDQTFAVIYRVNKNDMRQEIHELTVSSV